MTDLIKDFHNTKSAEVAKIIKHNSEPKLLNDSFTKLQEGLGQSKPKLIVCFGGAAYNDLTQAVNNQRIDLKNATIIKIGHYAYVPSYDRKAVQRTIIQLTMKK